jgi:DNA-binding MarR family transcriptional regulator
MQGATELDDLVTALLTASRALVAVSAESLAAVEDTVTLTQFRTLVVLTARGPCRLVELAGRLGVNASTAQRSVERLVAAGLVDRHENAADRREVVIGPTPAGGRLVHQVTRRRRGAIDEIVRAMPVGRRRQLVEALETFAAAAGEPSTAEEAGHLGW